MDSNKVTQKLSVEIEKLKVGDYTSYQNFYSQTANYLYQTIWNAVQNQNAADEILNELYTDIYASIGNELTNNDEFYKWAENKIHTITTTYLTTNNINSSSDNPDDNHKAEELAAAVAANTGMDATIGAGYGSVGMNPASSGLRNLGMGETGANLHIPGSGNTPGGGNIPGGAASGIGKAKKVLGVKIAVGAIGIIGIIGIALGIIHFINSNDDDETTTESEVITEEITVETVTEEINVETVTQDITEEIIIETE